MVYVTIFRKDNRIIEFNCIGHAEFDKRGKDIVCAAASILVINTINSIETLTDTKMKPVTNERDGLIDIEFPDGLNDESKLLIDSMVLGLEGIRDKYGKKFLRLEFKEV